MVEVLQAIDLVCGRQVSAGFDYDRVRRNLLDVLPFEFKADLKGGKGIYKGC